jgi:hypothetical protein
VVRAGRAACSTCAGKSVEIATCGGGFSFGSATTLRRPPLSAVEPGESAGTEHIIDGEKHTQTVKGILDLLVRRRLKRINERATRVCDLLFGGSRMPYRLNQGVERSSHER